MAKVFQKTPLRSYGVVEAENCMLDQVEYVKVKGKALLLRNFGHPIAAFYGAYSGGEVEPLPTNPSGGGLGSGVKPAVCCGNGEWCVMIPRDDTNFVSTASDDDLIVEMVTWHHYFNGNDHLYVPEHSYWKFTPVANPGACVGCMCP